MYDVLNHPAIDSTLSHEKANELILFDRNYPSYEIIAYLALVERKLVMRCSKNSFKTAR